MSENKIELKSISELLGMNFFIPSYQRGYRWTRQQIKDLLDDIQEFIEKKHDGFYCVQPLVVKERRQETFNLIKEQAQNLDEIRSLLKGSWEVIDGQQRLTTIYILLSYLEATNKYALEYETRPDSKKFLDKIDEHQKEENIDYYHIVESKEQIHSWFEKKAKEFKENFKENLLHNVKFIWYESVDEDPIKVFTRLNVGKISLTNAELIKALFLNKSNFDGLDYQKIRLQQQEISGEWDTIEYTLQNDEFWLFLNKPDYNKPTRIDFIFDLICEKNTLELSAEKMKELGDDEHKTFRYFYFWSKENNSNITECWQKVKAFFQIFREWFNDLELYHYIGFLIENNAKISKLIDEWNGEKQTKENFITKYIYDEIKQKISGCSDLYKQYEVNGYPKTQCRPILLLHNIQMIIDQNKILEENRKYKLPVFYKFPFHLFKKESWDVEHIDSNTENLLENEADRKEWLKYSSIGIDLPEDLKSKIKTYIEAKKEEEKPNFQNLYDEILEIYSKADSSKKLSDEEKNKIGNFTLLDSSTNRSYGNVIFPAKRRAIIGKIQGIKIEVNDNLELIPTKATSAFIPPCTEKIFQKTFNPLPNSLREWDKDDAQAYLNNIKDTLQKFYKEEEKK